MTHVSTDDQTLAFNDEELQEIKERFLAALPSDGTPRGNISLREELGIPEDLYWRVRDQLMEDGHVRQAQGRGGATAKKVVEPDPDGRTNPSVDRRSSVVSPECTTETLSSQHQPNPPSSGSQTSQTNQQTTSLLTGITSISVTNFKRISSVVLPLGKITFLVGGNNSGKSSVLQAIHTAMCCARTSLETSETVIPEQALLYAPTASFYTLGHNEHYTNTESTNRRGRVTLKSEDDSDSHDEYSIEIYRARNHNSIGVKRKGSPQVSKAINDKNSLFSVYVPGLSGIRHTEEFIAYPSVLRMVAGAEANFVFRNVLRLLQNQNKIHELEKYVSIVLGESVKFLVEYEEDRDVEIIVKMSTNSLQAAALPVSIEMWGTGVLQVVQIFAYALLFMPKLLLIDEPDSHVHPSAQKRLMKALRNLAEDLPCQVILSTHSRHILSERKEEDSLLWLRDGELNDRVDYDLIPMLMDIGALDVFDENNTIFLVTEDEDTSMLTSVLGEMSPESHVQVVSSGGLQNLYKTNLIAQILSSLPSSVRKIIHRDCDFLLPDEIEKWKSRFKIEGLEFFVPELCDLESYYCSADHIASVSHISLQEAEELRMRVILSAQGKLRDKFVNKRADPNREFYPLGGSPSTDVLWPCGMPPKPEQVYGKELLKQLDAELRNKLGDKKFTLKSKPPKELILLLQERIEKVGDRVG